MRYFSLFVTAFCLFFNGFCFAQQSDTLSLSIDSAESLFLKNNLPLLAQKYEIEASRAAIIQAKVFENPSFYFENNIYNSNNGKYFDFSSSGESVAQLSQLFYLSGKRKKRANVEKINTQINEYEYYDILRNLRYELHTDFYRLHYLLQSLNMYSEQIVSATKIADALNEQYKKGNIALKEVTRVKALVFSLSNNRLQVLNEIQEKQNSLKILTRSASQGFILPVIDENSVERLSLNDATLQKLFSAADTMRFDLKESSSRIEMEQANYSLQKALAIPDITLGVTYDKAGSFIPHYYGMGIGIPLPAWNRNQGNIEIAKNEIEKSKVEYEQKRQEVQNEVALAYSKATESERLYKSFDKSFTDDYNKLINGITDQYQKRNISLLEFLDYYETYTESMKDMFDLSSNRIAALEEVNLAVGTTVIK